MQENIFNPTENDERNYLEHIKRKLEIAIADTDSNVNSVSKEIQENKEYLWENKAGMDHAEKVAVRQSIDQFALTGENAVAKKKRLSKLLLTPYFGRIDFIRKGENNRLPVYVGVHSFIDFTENINYVHDWRAPISGMFYDFELGEAYFEAPTGETRGEILLKRQYRIRQGEMEFMLESSLNIHDDILQKELSATSDEKMKDIVATIQRDQNLIIRNEKSRVLIIQGVAGSGKTSIALHRIAFLLYRFKQTISSKDILIISPNKVFADYISNVLPELGEEKIQEIGMEELAHQIMDNKVKFQTFFEQVSLILEKGDENFIERIRFKSSFDFINKLNEYLVHIENEYFTPTDIVIRKMPVPAWFIEERFKAYHRIPILKRFPEIVKDVIQNIYLYYQYETDTAEKNYIKKEVNSMFRTTNLRALYKDFYQWIDRPDLFKLAKASTFEYADVYPFVYFKMRLEGIKSYEKVKHLLVDEMQDYTPVQYAVISKLFPCNKTILGDASQSVNPYSSSTSEDIQRVFTDSEGMKLCKSYRSTYEITEFAQIIHRNAELVAIERHGEKPTVTELKNEASEMDEIKRIINTFTASENNSLGIICKTQPQADKLYEQIKGHQLRMYLLNAQSAAFARGIVVTTTHMAKGLEFDHVIVPFCTTENYKTDIDKHMLYIACTRAMHKLDVTYWGMVSGFVVEGK
ncbi:MAG: AAA family ATPase [Bacteroidales bacterium]|nr:AAA family ATPase [Bacteroidales bacterium]MCF8454499.1 AAA family ATPase [Bacteroidales bacterium]